MRRWWPPPRRPRRSRAGAFVCRAGLARPLALRQTDDDVAVALAGPAQRFELRQDARIEPDMHAAILGALRLNSDGSERQRGGGGRYRRQA